MKFDVIILAAGNSTRFGKDKTSSRLSNGITVLQTVVGKFSNNKNVNNIFIVGKDLESTKVLIDQNERIFYVNGGKTRAMSFVNAIKEVDTEYVYVHDGCRPFITDEFINSFILNDLKNYHIVVPYIKVVNSLKSIVDEKIITVNRDNFFQTQTPQMINRKVFLDIIKRVKSYEWQDELDLYCKFYDRSKVKLIDGIKENIKITFREDLK